MGFWIAKCLAGALYNWVALHYIPNQGDIWGYYADGLTLFRTVLDDPLEIGPLLRQTFLPGDLNLTNTDSDFVRNAFEGIKFIHLLLNFLSGGNIYTNTILFNGIALVVFLRCWVFLKKETGGWAAGAWLFLFPSAFFYSSAIHKEGIVLILLATLLPLFRSFYHKPGILNSLGILLFTSLLLFFKVFVALLFLGGVLIWYLMEKFPRQKKWMLAGLLAGGVLVFFGSAWLDLSLNLPAIIASRQQEFLALEASSKFDMPVLERNGWSYIRALPSAIGNVFFKPLPGQGGRIFYLAFTLEIAFFWGLMLSFAIRSGFKVKFSEISPIITGLTIFALSYLLVIGYTIPNIGATMRYRSIFIPFTGLFFYLLFHGHKTMYPVWRKWVKKK